jgi:hypothetical protein
MTFSNTGIQAKKLGALFAIPLEKKLITSLVFMKSCLKSKMKRGKNINKNTTINAAMFLGFFKTEGFEKNMYKNIKRRINANCMCIFINTPQIIPRIIQCNNLLLSEIFFSIKNTNNVPIGINIGHQATESYLAAMGLIDQNSRNRIAVFLENK